MLRTILTLAITTALIAAPATVAAQGRWSAELRPVGRAILGLSARSADDCDQRSTGQGKDNSTSKVHGFHSWW